MHEELDNKPLHNDHSIYFYNELSKNIYNLFGGINSRIKLLILTILSSMLLFSLEKIAVFFTGRVSIISWFFSS